MEQPRRLSRRLPVSARQPALRGATLLSVPAGAPASRRNQSPAPQRPDPACALASRRARAGASCTTRSAPGFRHGTAGMALVCGVASAAVQERQPPGPPLRTRKGIAATAEEGTSKRRCPHAASRMSIPGRLPDSSESSCAARGPSRSGFIPGIAGLLLPLLKGRFLLLSPSIEKRVKPRRTPGNRKPVGTTGGVPAKESRACSPPADRQAQRAITR